MVGVENTCWGLKTRAGGRDRGRGCSKTKLGLERCCWGLKTRSWGLKSVAGWLKRVVEGSWVVETRAGGLKDEARGSKTCCWWLRYMAGVDKAWLGVKNAW
jgi:hypothetical protein